MTQLAVLFVPFILSNFHRKVADKALSTLKNCNVPIKTYAVVNASRNGTDDEQWLASSFDDVTYNDVNILSRAWNKGITNALSEGASKVLVSNLDLEFHPQALTRLLACAERNPNEYVWSADRWHTARTLLQAELKINDKSGTNWSCFMVDHRLFETVGQFDERFAPAYQEDSDMSYRMHLKGIPRGVTARDALVYHTELGTIKGCLQMEHIPVSDKLTIAKAMRQMVTTNDQRYKEKWGGLPGDELYTKPKD
jgi:hypothetical protein